MKINKNTVFLKYSILFFILCILLSILSIIIYISIIQNNKIECFNVKEKLKIIIFDTDKNHKHLLTLIKTLEKYNADYIILGNDIKWKGFGTKILEIEKYLKTLDPTQIVAIIDARDVLINNDPQKALDYYYKNSDNKIIFGAEMGCCTKGVPNYVKSFMYELAKNEKEYQFNYLNAGLYIGSVQNILQLYKNINIKATEDDQSKITNYWYNNRDIIKLDYHQEIFSNSNAWDDKKLGCFFIKDEILDRMMNSIKNTYPVFIHTPAKHFRCYRYIASEIINTT